MNSFISIDNKAQQFLSYHSYCQCDLGSTSSPQVSTTPPLLLLLGTYRSFRQTVFILEETEYAKYREAFHFITVLQTKARHLLRQRTD